jgi:hypothetical protein
MHELGRAKVVHALGCAPSSDSSLDSIASSAFRFTCSPESAAWASCPHPIDV